MSAEQMGTVAKHKTAFCYW